MRTAGDGLRDRARALAAAAVAAVLVACAAAPAEPPQRTYDRIRTDQLYPMTRAVFAAAGYASEPCHVSTVCIETTWREYDGERRGGAAAVRERRMYMARYERDPVDDRYMLFLSVRLQARGPGGADWADRPVDFASDAEYPQILREIDLAVRKLGGVQY